METEGSTRNRLSNTGQAGRFALVPLIYKQPTEEANAADDRGI